MEPEVPEAPYAEIKIKQVRDYIEISHERVGKLTIYRPTRKAAWEISNSETNPITPGWINASSWFVGGSIAIGKVSAPDVRVAMLLQLHIIDIALETLNNFNQVLPDWIPIRSPFEDARSLKLAYMEINQLREELKTLKEKKTKKKVKS